MVVEELRWSALRRESLSVSRSDINSDRVVLSDWRRVALSHPRHRPWIRTGSNCDVTAVKLLSLGSVVVFEMAN